MPMWTASSIPELGGLPERRSHVVLTTHRDVHGERSRSGRALRSLGKTGIKSSRVRSQLPYDKLEIVCNGDVIASASPSGQRHASEIRLEYQLRGSCWIAARAMEDLGRYPGVDFSAIHRAKARCLGAFTERGVRRTSSPTPRRLCDARREAGPELGRRAILCRLHAARHRLVEFGSAIRQRRGQESHAAFERGEAVYRAAGSRERVSLTQSGQSNDTILGPAAMATNCSRSP